MHRSKYGYAEALPIACCLLLVCAFSLAACRSRKPARKPVAAAEGQAPDEPGEQVAARSPKAAIDKATRSSPTATKDLGRQVSVSWYDVPRSSLAARRAIADEFTAAHNRLRIGTHLRLTNPVNEKSVIVRVTDRGIPRRGAELDICKPAAAELGILGAGVAKLRMEILPEEKTPGADRATESAAPRP